MFASTKNVAARARVTTEQAESAIQAFESPDPDSGDPENDGRRIERFPGGWLVLNAHKYRAIVTKAVARERTRERVAKFRAKKEECNADVTKCNVPVTPSDAEAYADTESETNKEAAAPLVLHESLPKKEWEEWIEHRKTKRWPRDRRTLGKQLTLLAKYPEDVQREMIDTAINAGWQGLFAPKAQFTAAKKSTWVPPKSADQVEAEARARGEIV